MCRGIEICLLPTLLQQARAPLQAVIIQRRRPIILILSSSSFLLLFAGEHGVEQATAGEQNDHDADRRGDHVLRVSDAHGRDDAYRVRVRAAREDARVLREPRPAHHIQLPDGGERRFQLHAVLRDEPQVPSHAHDHVHAVPGGPARAQRYAPVVGQLPAIRHHSPAEHRGDADVRHHRRVVVRRRRRKTRTARAIRHQPRQTRRRRQQQQQATAADRHGRPLSAVVRRRGPRVHRRSPVYAYYTVRDTSSRR